MHACTAAERAGGDKPLHPPPLCRNCVLDPFGPAMVYLHTGGSIYIQARLSMYHRPYTLTLVMARKSCHVHVLPVSLLCRKTMSGPFPSPPSSALNSN